MSQYQHQQQIKLLDLAEDAIYIIDYATSSIKFWNNGAHKQYGWTKEEAVGQDAWDLLNSNFAIPIETFEVELHQRDGWEGEVTCQTRTGESRISMSRWALQRDDDGKPSAILVINHDIGALKKAEAELRNANMQTEMFLNAIPSLLIGLNTDHVISRWNPAAEATFRLSSSTVLGKRLATCGIEWVEGSPDLALDDLAGQNDKSLDRVQFVRNGEVRILGLKVSRVQANGCAAGILIVGADITARIELESQLRQAQKLEAIGQLAAGIAHEINTPTQFVGDNMRFVKDCWEGIAKIISISREMRTEAQPGPVSPETLTEFDSCWKDTDMDYLLEEVPRALDQSRDGLGRVTKIVGAMKEFSHPGGEGKKPLDIKRAIESTVIIASNEWKYVAEVETNFSADTPWVSCLAGEFNQVILNLLINAAHAIAEKNESSGERGTITITTQVETGWLEIQIKDTGAGIPERVRGKVFDPFFTTKEIGKGTGQGLALAHTVIVKKHDGQIWFKSAVGEGTTFFIRLPLDARKVDAELTSEKPEYSSANNQEVSA